MELPGLTHHHARINGIRMHWVEAGAGDPVVLCHGFPHTWISWHHQIAALAGVGYRVIVPDMRGMGQTEGPREPEGYDCFHTAGDLAGLLDHLGLAQAVFAGLDFGIFAVIDCAHLHPGRVRAIIALENPFYADRADMTPLAEAAEWAQSHFVHIDYFRAPGVADAALDAEPRKFLERVYYALSGEYRYLNVWEHPPGTPYIEALPAAPPLPWSWLTAEVMDAVVADYEKSGFTGGLNWYRAMDLRWHQRAAWRGQRTTQPYFFIGSDRDVDLEAWHGDDPLGAIHDHHGQVRRVAMVPRAGHMMQLEAPEPVNALLLEFLAAL